MQLLLVIFLLEPVSILELPVRCTRIENYEEINYLLQENNRAIIKIDTARNVLSIPVEGGVINRIYGFDLTPFSIYLNMPGGLFKLSINSGLIEKIYTGDVVSFTLNDAEEIILADRFKKEVLFLDSQYRIRLIKSNFNVVDMDYFDKRIYLLTRKEIIVFDDYGNMIERIKIPEKKERIVASGKIYLFTSAQNTILRKDKEWDSIKLNHSFIDLKITKKNVLILNQYGDTLYIYDKSDF
uniref:Uncharacterized protein n=1 Tax=candidate division WOR-3 bacterium TaxID=2052148 RepID=A0A7C6EI92_UNCW3